MQTLQLTFNCTATSDLNLGGWNAGSNIRGALGQRLRRMTCEERTRTAAPTADHVLHCPACRILAQETEETKGNVYRAYALIPPTAPQTRQLQTGDPFQVGLRLFGAGQEFLPHFVVALGEIGQQGVGIGRGTFQLDSITAENPLTLAREALMSAGERYVSLPETFINPMDVEGAAQQLLRRMQANNQTHLQVRFQTLTRLIAAKKLVKTPDFGVLAGRLFDRIEALHKQWGNGWPDVPVKDLRQLADQVRLLSWDGRWQEARSGSRRTGRKNPISGLVGTAIYQSNHWNELLPWLVWGQVTQVGKDVVKGNGIYQIML